MKYLTHKYNNQPFDFYIFGDRISTNLFYLDDSESPLIHNTVYTDIKTYLKQLAEAQNPDKHRFSSTPQDNINHINEIIQAINDRWTENKKDTPNERNEFIIDAPQKQFLPLIASHTLNKELVDYFFNLNNNEINCGLIRNPLLTVDRVIQLVKQEPALGHHLIQDTSYQIPPTLLRFFVEQDRLNNQDDDKYRFSINIIAYRKNLTEKEITTILPALRDNVIFKVVLGQDLPQYINESLIFNGKNLQTLSLLSTKYKHQEHIIDRLIYLQTGGRELYQLFDTVNLSGNSFRLPSSFLI